jgi:dipeptidyl aminopeptidase/acylaminoacyl peptidase
VIVGRRDFDGNREFQALALLRLDTVSGVATPISHGGPDFTKSWVLDHAGRPRAAVTWHEQKHRLHWKATPDAPWTLANEWQTFGETRETWTPLAVDAANRLYVRTRPPGGDLEILQRAPMESGERTWQELVSLEGFDFTGSLVWGGQGRLAGVRYLTDARGTHWYDAAMKTVQAEIDKALPGLINELDCGRCETIDKVLVKSWSDRQPMVAQIYDTKTKVLKPLTATMPWIKPAQMARREFTRFKSADGLDIPVHVTRPAGAKAPLPAVVLVHGGPYVRGGEWEWDADSQFLASRGYAVNEPEFRGSTGFGFKHFKAAWKQWGLAMQDDLAAATRWAVEKGIADPKRVCIAGNSYGGYAAMMGLVRHGELYRCGINWSGVTDIDLLYTARWSDHSALWRDYGMPVLIGDRDKNAEQFRLTSPVKQADKIQRPVMMAYGEEDRRVPIAHGYALRDAVQKHNREVEWVVYKNEGHGWLLESNRVDFWTRVEKFLARHLAP